MRDIGRFGIICENVAKHFVENVEFYMYVCVVCADTCPLYSFVSLVFIALSKA